MSPFVYYIATLVVLFFIFCIQTWGLNLQFGTAGILNFTYITFFAVGAYFTGTAMMARPDALSNMRYILGLSLPFPIAILIGATAAGVLGLLVGLVALRRLRSDYLAIVTVSVGAIVFDFVNITTWLFNGADGIAGIPYPFNDSMPGGPLDPNTYIFFYLGVAGIFTLVLGIIAFRIYNSPLGRTLRAIREDSDVASAFGKDTYRFRMIAMVVGCVYAGIAAGLLVGFVVGLTGMGGGALMTPILVLIFKIEPLAAARDLELRLRAELSEEGQGRDGGALLRELADRGAVVCGHGGLDNALRGAPKWRKGSAFVLDRDLRVVEQI